MDKVFKIAVDYSMCGEVEIAAKTFKEALFKAENVTIPDVKNREYIDDSFNVNEEMSKYLNDIGEKNDK